MKIQKHAWKDGVFVAVGPATLQSTLSPESVPDSYALSVPREDGTTHTEYHWLAVAIEDNNGEVRTGGAMLPHKLFVKNPEVYTKGNKIEVAIQLNKKGAGYCQVHLGNGRFEVSNLVSEADLSQYAIQLDSNEPTETIKETVL